jgi:TetR/AcrR family transcriptional repressor of bet genes
MARASTARLRRRELQKAAFEVACKYGLNGLTVEKVARHAGSSKGIVHHYFEGKLELMEHAMRYAHRILAEAARAKFRKVRTPSERIWAIVEANFLPQIMRPEYFRLWFEALDYPQFSHVIDVFERRMHSNMVFALKMLVPPEEARGIAFGIMNLYDGLGARVRRPGRHPRKRTGRNCTPYQGSGPTI